MAHGTPSLVLKFGLSLCSEAATTEAGFLLGGDIDLGSFVTGAFLVSSMFAS